MKKIISATEAISKVKEGMSVMVGGFLACGTPHQLLDALVNQGTKNLTIINNDTSFVDRGVGRLVVSNQVKKAIVSHIGTNPETGKKMHANEIEVELVPQGTLAERIRAGGAGLGAVVTPTGVGTMVEEGKQKITLNGREYLLEMPLRADVALIQAEIADEKGNLIFDKAARNFNPLMVMAADLVIVEVKKIVPVGELDPNFVMIPGEVVHFIVKEELNMRERIAKRVAKEFSDGDVINLGIGLPTLVANYIPQNISVTLQSENGFLGIGPAPEAGKEDPNLVNAGGQPVTVLPGGAFFDSAFSFVLIRGGHVAATVLGALQVDEEGNLANWMVPGKIVPGMGGAMDLVVGARKVIVAMEHTAKGAIKIMKKCSLPLTAVKVVHLIITEMGVIEVTPEGLVLKELAPDTTVAAIQAVTEATLIISPDLKVMEI